MDESVNLKPPFSYAEMYDIPVPEEGEVGWRIFSMTTAELLLLAQQACSLCPLQETNLRDSGSEVEVTAWCIGILEHNAMAILRVVGEDGRKLAEIKALCLYQYHDENTSFRT